MSFVYNLFDDSTLPKPLEQSELYNYFGKYKFGDKTARKTIIEHNIRLVLKIVLEKYSNTPYDQRDLFSIGMIGLIKGVDTFDISKKTKFSTYAGKCIRNEICKFMRKEMIYKKHISEVSLNQSIKVDTEDEELKIENILSYNDYDFVSEYEDKETYQIIRKIVNELPELEKNIIIKYYGFKDNNPMTQQEIADELGLTKAWISVIIREVLEYLSYKLKDLGIVDKTFKREKYKKI